MAIYLKENEIGFDPQKVGFPGLGSCMAIALQTPHGLFGFHAYGNNNPKGATFATFCQTHAHYGTPLHLYGSATFANRYAGSNKFLQWLAEMKFVAGQLNYRGVVSGFDISHPGAGVPVGLGKSAYLLYKRHPTTGVVSLRYASSDDVNYNAAVDPTSTVRRILPDLRTDAPYNNKVVQTVTKKPAAPGGPPAKLKPVGDNGLYSVSVP